MNSLNKKR